VWERSPLRTAFQSSRLRIAWFSSCERGRIDVMKSPGCPTGNFGHDIFLSLHRGRVSEKTIRAAAMIAEMKAFLLKFPLF